MGDIDNGKFEKYRTLSYLNGEYGTSNNGLTYNYIIYIITYKISSYIYIYIYIYIYEYLTLILVVESSSITLNDDNNSPIYYFRIIY